MKLYTPELLALSTSLADFPALTEPDLVASVRSRTCGSTLDIGLRVGSSGEITQVGMHVFACAVGQSAATIFARGAKGQDLAKLEHSLDQINHWLNGDGELPDWPGFEALSAAQPHSGRHEALRLPWRAGISALSSAQSRG